VPVSIEPARSGLLANAPGELEPPWSGEFVLSLALTQLRFDSLPKQPATPGRAAIRSPALPEVATTNVIKRHRNAYSELTEAYESSISSIDRLT